MKLFIRLFKESVLFAVQSLIVNKLRTFLSLLGITIGIFAIISVFTMVDSMERKIKSSIESLGENVIFVQKWPWEFGSDYPWWKYINRPVPTLEELEALNKTLESAEASTFLISTRGTAKFESNMLENVSVMIVSDDYNKVREFDLERGRYFTENEFKSGRPAAIIGSDVALALYGNITPVGKTVKIKGRRLNVIGVFRKEGESMVGNSMDNVLMTPINYARTIVDVKNPRLNPQILVKAKAGVINAQLKDELTGVMRSIRKLKPRAENNFALNETSILSKGFEDLFGIVNWAGIIIGMFSILVGGFGIANIMFVSVKERTQLIGIQKSLGAKNFFILFQFLSEAVILCLIGGGTGLLIIFAGTLLLFWAADLEVFLSITNIFLGLFISAAIGLVAGIVPAWSASRLDPVEAIRAN